MHSLITRSADWASINATAIACAILVSIAFAPASSAFPVMIPR